ncbi:glycosyltransferase [Lichenihabitans psoromatis]|uniref:glycosyltransferase n=1 Tax=Lichenihabitans psoromatis TaxID=2528642 RepID=UPI0013F16BC7|nr:glycosyltransferase [Lichenihabitans psoromatis]
MQVSISVVINTLNRCETLEDTLASFAGVDYENFEIIVVAGPSSDRTGDVLRGYEGSIKIVEVNQANLSVSRNAGINAASGEVVAFIDDDAVPHPNWLKSLARHYGDEKVGAVGGFTLDNTGSKFQVCKTICDRVGNAYNVSRYFDERALCLPYSPYYPSLLGTNASFRRSALRIIGGFDPTFAYYLDETDVCVRLVDAGFQVVYEPTALVYHQYAPSDLRDRRHIHKTLYPSVKSKSYFAMKHGSRMSLHAVAEEMERYKLELLRSNQWHLDHNEISPGHKASLDRDVEMGIADGRDAAANGSLSRHDDVSLADPSTLFLPYRPVSGLCVALVSRGFPPHNDTGIARWTSILASGLARRGHHVHVITEAHGEASTAFRNQMWIHRILPNPALGEQLQSEFDVPSDVAAWSAAVRLIVGQLKSFGLQIVSAPIWDLEGLGVENDPDLISVTSLHTTYSLAKQFKDEWHVRPLFSHHHVEKIIRQEERLFRNAPLLLANSRAIVTDLAQVFAVNPSPNVTYSVHGTLDPLETRTRPARKKSLRVAFVGRFEARKGYEVAARAICALLAQVEDVECIFVGGVVDRAVAAKLRRLGYGALFTDRRVIFKGLLSRSDLDDLYASTDIVLMPSRYESFGLVAIEAMAAGSVPICFAVGGLKEVVVWSGPLTMDRLAIVD